MSFTVRLECYSTIFFPTFIPLVCCLGVLSLAASFICSYQKYLFADEINFLKLLLFHG